jgi:hypothetical protein
VNEWKVEGAGGPHRVSVEFVFIGQKMVTPLVMLSSVTLVLALAWFLRAALRRRRVPHASS